MKDQKRKGRPRGRVVGPTIVIRLNSEMDRMLRKAAFSLGLSMARTVRTLTEEGLEPGTQELVLPIRRQLEKEIGP